MATSFIAIYSYTSESGYLLRRASSICDEGLWVANELARNR